MSKIASAILFFTAYATVVAQVPPVNEGELSSTRLLSIERITTDTPEQGPDGLSFSFLVSPTPVARHKFAIKETHDFTVAQRSYRELSQSTLGRVFKSKMAVHDASKYAIDHPGVASAIAAAPQRSLMVTLALSGPTLKDGDAVEVVLHVGFGRSAEKPEGEDLVFKTTVPAR
jgi:hypothetical protein